MNRFVPCWKTQVATLYRCNADGTDIRMLSNNAEQENTPWMLPDGRVLYMRWEYVDRNQLLYHHLWTVNPDGTAVMVYFGNQYPGYVMIDAKPIPDSDKIVASFSPGHGRAEHMGYVTIVDPKRGPDDMKMARRVSSGSYRDPYPLSEALFLVADNKGIHFLTGEGRSELIYGPEDTAARWQCHEPRPLRSASRNQSSRAASNLIHLPAVCSSPTSTKAATWRVSSGARSRSCSSWSSFPNPPISPEDRNR